MKVYHFHDVCTINFVIPAFDANSEIIFGDDII